MLSKIRAMDDRSARWQRILDVPVMVAVAATIPIVILEQGTPGEPLAEILAVADWVIWCVFTIELVVMLVVTKGRIEYLRTHLLEVAIVLLTPPFLSFALQSIRVLRLLRLVRLTRVGRLLRRAFTVEGIRYAVALTALVWLGGAQAYALAEGTSFGIGVYWAIETMTTVGYGDVVPHSTLGRVVAVVLMVIGTGFIALVTGAMAQHFLSGKVEAAAEEIETTDAELLARIAAMSEQLRSLESMVRARARG